MELLIHPKLPQALTTRSSETSVTIPSMGPEPGRSAEIALPLRFPHRIRTWPGMLRSLALLIQKGSNWDMNAQAFLELRRWDDLQSVKTLPLSFGQAFLQSLAFSPDDSWIAIAISRSGCVCSTAPMSSPWHSSMAASSLAAVHFHPTRTCLPAAHTFQGGGYVSIYRIEDGQIDRSMKNWIGLRSLRQ